MISLLEGDIGHLGPHGCFVLTAGLEEGRDYFKGYYVFVKSLLLFSFENKCFVLDSVYGTESLTSPSACILGPEKVARAYAPKRTILQPTELSAQNLCFFNVLRNRMLVCLATFGNLFLVAS